MAEPLLIRGARLLDPSSGMDRVGDLLVTEGRIHRVGESIRDGDIPPDCQVVPGDGLVACPGFIDLHCHLREPGYEEKETIATGSLAAARGGFTTVCCMSNTDPPIDNVKTVDFIARKAAEAGLVRVLPIGCVSKGRRGRDLVAMRELAQAGVIGYSDDGSPVADASLMQQALREASGLGLPIIDHCEDPALSQGGVVNAGWFAEHQGLPGWPAAAEEGMVARDIALAERTGGRVHLAHLSSTGSVELVHRAKARGLPVTAEVTPHHLTLSETWVFGHDHKGPLDGSHAVGAYDTAAKVNPPLRSPEDVAALIAGLREGVIDAIATDHAPHAAEEKRVAFEEAAWGISGLETALGALLLLVHRKEIDLMTLVARLTTGALAVLGDPYRELAALRPGTTADVVLFDPEAEWVVRGRDFASKGKNTPLEGVTLRGKVVMTIVGGRPVYSALADLPADTVGSVR